MRQKKIRGHHRRQKQIDSWRLDNMSFDLTDYLLNEQDRYYAKIRVYPWNGISVTNSVIPEPTRKTKQKIVSALLDIYENWKSQLDKLGQPYYLKLWLFEPHFSQSQVVCAIGDSIDFYENTFYKPDNVKVLRLDNYGILKTRLNEFNYEHRLDEVHYDNTEIGDPELYASIDDFEATKQWFKKLLSKPHRTVKFKEPIGEITESYSFKKGDIWLIGKK